jgi:hypothetical protein
MTAKDRQARSKHRQKLGLKLALWRQRVKDMEVAQARGAPDAAKKMAFCRQEQAKAEKAMRKLEVGVRLQRVWASGRSEM